MNEIKIVNVNDANPDIGIWRTREDARLGGRGPWHAKARAAARELYESIVFSTMELVIEDGVKSWHISEWKDGHA